MRFVPRRRIAARLALGALGCALLVGCATAAPGDQPAAATSSAAAPVQETATRPAATPTRPPTPTNTATPSPTNTATPSPSPTHTPSPTPTSTPTPTLQPTPDGLFRQARVPILMYHHLADPPPGADRYRRDLSVSPALFAEHLAFLRDQGYHSITLEQVLRHLALGEPLPERPVVITFDDGYADNYANALPLLREYGFGATFFVVTELAERASAGMTAPDGMVYADEYMTWEQLQEMSTAGMEIQCHARVHEDLTDADDERLTWQVLGCREMIESRLGERPRFVAYPSGIYDGRVAAFFASDDYWGAVTTHQGIVQRSDQPFEFNRLRLRSTTSVAELAELLAWDAE